MFSTVCHQLRTYRELLPWWFAGVCVCMCVCAHDNGTAARVLWFCGRHEYSSTAVLCYCVSRVQRYCATVCHEYCVTVCRVVSTHMPVHVNNAIHAHTTHLSSCCICCACAHAFTLVLVRTFPAHMLVRTFPALPALCSSRTCYPRSVRR